RDYHTADRAADCAALGMAVGVCGYRRTGVLVAGVLVAPVSETGGGSSRECGRACIHPQRSFATGDKISVEAIDRVSADVGVCRDEVHHRSDLVVLFVLGA